MISKVQYGRIVILKPAEIYFTLESWTGDQFCMQTLKEFKTLETVVVFTGICQVVSLQLEMEAIYSSLEEEALEIAADANSSR